jgi:hypothetical protein
MFSQLFLPHVKAVDVEITSISPENRTGNVGETIRVVGTINTTNGLYQIWFGDRLVVNETAEENNVSVSFLVPALPKGNYTLTLWDVAANINATSWFYIENAYYIQISTPASPEQLQENATVEVSVSVTGGEANVVYVANVTVKAPTPSNETYSKLVSLSNTTDTGIGNATITYPDDFGGGAHTNYTGTYTVSFNETLAIETFFVGLTDRTEYHRGDTVNIKAAGYQPYENVTVKILFGTEVLSNQTDVQADDLGFIFANWTVPMNATIGEYTVNITSTSSLPTKKEVPDLQNFSIPGFDVNVTVRNLAGETVQNVTVRVYENGKSVVNKTTDSNGIAYLKLENGSYNLQAYFKEQKVNETTIEVRGVASFNVVCNLTNMKVIAIAIKDENEIRMPEVKINLTSQSENLTLTTDINGTVEFHSLLPHASYELNSSRYDVMFNTTRIATLLIDGEPVAWYNVTIVCPTYTLKVNVTNPTAANKPINNATVKVLEFMGGLYYENTTVNGVVTFNCVLGKYYVEVYTRGIKINDATVDLTNGSKTLPLSCKLYGLTLVVHVVDYFGQPIAGANVTVLRQGLNIQSNQTNSIGGAEFSDLIGGDLQIAVYLPGQTQVCDAKNYYIDYSATIQIKIEKYVSLFGFLIETGQLATIVIIAVTVAIILLLEIHRRRTAAKSVG